MRVFPNICLSWHIPAGVTPATIIRDLTWFLTLPALAAPDCDIATQKPLLKHGVPVRLPHSMRTNERRVRRTTAGVHFGHPGYVWISFFTDWTFCLFGFTGVIGTVVTAQRWARDRSLRRHGAPCVPTGAVAPAPAIGGQPPVAQTDRKGAEYSELGMAEALQPRVRHPSLTNDSVPLPAPTACGVAEAFHLICQARLALLHDICMI